MLIGIDANEANISQRVGSNVFAFELIKALTDLDNDNEYTFYLSEKKQPDLPKSSLKVGYRVLYPSFLWTRWRLPFDLFLHRPCPNVFFTPGHYGPRWSPVPRVITILDLSFYRFPQAYKPAVLWQLKNWTRRAAMSAAHILTISQASKKDIVYYYRLPPEKITVVYPGISRSIPETLSPSRLRAVQAISTGNDYLLFLGTRQPNKNLSRLIAAFVQLSPRYPDLKLVIVGKAWKQFQSAALPLNLPPQVIVTDFLPQETVTALIKGARALVAPSLFEGFGFPAAQAMALGTPVIVSSTGSLPEIVGQAGILVDPLSIASIAGGISRLLCLSQSKRLELTRLGRRLSRRFTWESCAQKTLEVLHAVAV